MNIQEALQFIEDPDSPMVDRIEASSVLSLSDDDATLADLVKCLRCRGVIAELSAVGLCRRTGRPRAKRVRDFANPDLWEQYLIRMRLEAEGSGV